MTCNLHATTQTWCRQCETAAEDAPRYDSVVGNPLLRETIVGGMPLSPPWPSHPALPPAPLIVPDGTGRHDAQQARIAGLEANVNMQLTRIAVLEAALALAIDSRDKLATALRGVLAIVTVAGGYMPQEQQDVLREARRASAEVP